VNFDWIQRWKYRAKTAKAIRKKKMATTMTITTTIWVVLPFSAARSVMFCSFDTYGLSGNHGALPPHPEGKAP